MSLYYLPKAEADAMCLTCPLDKCLGLLHPGCPRKQEERRRMNSYTQAQRIQRQATRTILLAAVALYWRNQPTRHRSSLKKDKRPYSANGITDPQAIRKEALRRKLRGYHPDIHGVI